MKFSSIVDPSPSTESHDLRQAGLNMWSSEGLANGLLTPLPTFKDCGSTEDSMHSAMV